MVKTAKQTVFKCRVENVELAPTMLIFKYHHKDKAYKLNIRPIKAVAYSRIYTIVMGKRADVKLKHMVIIHDTVKRIVTLVDSRNSNREVYYASIIKRA